MATAKPAKNKSSTQTEGRDARATNWSETETKALIAVWTDEDTQTATEDPFLSVLFVLVVVRVWMSRH